MEEILASIRKIISEDQAEPAPAAQAAQTAIVEPVAETEEPEDADVLELTHEVREETRVAAPVFARAPQPVVAPAPIPEPEPEAEPEPAEAAAGSEVPAPDDVAFVEDTHEERPMSNAGEDIIPDSARRAMNKAFTPYRQPDAAPVQMPNVEGAQLESVFTRAVMQSFDPVLRDWMNNNSESVVQNMKPIIREWMDENLPDLIERAVKSEMAAAVRMATKKR